MKRLLQAIALLIVPIMVAALLLMLPVAKADHPECITLEYVLNDLRTVNPTVQFAKLQVLTGKQATKFAEVTKFPGSDKIVKTYLQWFVFAGIVGVWQTDADGCALLADGTRSGDSSYGLALMPKGMVADIFMMHQISPGVVVLI